MTRRRDGGAEADDTVLRPPARMTLFGFESTAAEVDLVPRTTAWRVARTARVIGLTFVVAPLVFLLPPHAPWAAGAVGGGILLAVRRWKEHFTLRHARGTCPRCGTVLESGGVQRLRRPHVMPCDSCHHESVLDVTLD